MTKPEAACGNVAFSGLSWQGRPAHTAVPGTGALGPPAGQGRAASLPLAFVHSDVSFSKRQVSPARVPGTLRVGSWLSWQSQQPVTARISSAAEHHVNMSAALS